MLPPTRCVAVVLLLTLWSAHIQAFNGPVSFPGPDDGIPPFVGVNILDRVGQPFRASVGDTFDRPLVFNQTVPTRTLPVYECSVNGQTSCTLLSNSDALVQTLATGAASPLQFQLGTLERVYATADSSQQLPDPANCSLGFETGRGVGFNQTALFAFGSSVGDQTGNVFTHCNQHRLGLTPLSLTHPGTGQVMQGVYVKVYAQGALNVYLTGSFNRRAAGQWRHPRDITAGLETSQTVVQLSHAPIVPSKYARMLWPSFRARYINATTHNVSSTDAQRVRKYMFEEDVFHALVVGNASTFNQALYQIVVERAPFTDKTSVEERRALADRSLHFTSLISTTQQAITLGQAQLTSILGEIRRRSAHAHLLSGATLQDLFELEGGGTANRNLTTTYTTTLTSLTTTSTQFVESFQVAHVNLTATYNGLNDVMRQLVALTPAHAFTNAATLATKVASLSAQLQTLEDNVMFTLPNANMDDVHLALRHTALLIIETLSQVTLPANNWTVIDPLLNQALVTVRTVLGPNSGFLNALQTVYLTNLLDTAIDWAAQVGEDAGNVRVASSAEPYDLTTLAAQVSVLGNVVQRGVDNLQSAMDHVHSVLDEITNSLPADEYTSISSSVGSSDSAETSSYSAAPNPTRYATMRALTSSLLLMTRLSQTINVTIADAPIAVLVDLLHQVTPQQTSNEVGQTLTAASEWIQWMLNSTGCKAEVINYAPTLLDATVLRGGGGGGTAGGSVAHPKTLAEWAANFTASVTALRTGTRTLSQVRGTIYAATLWLQAAWDAAATQYLAAGSVANTTLETLTSRFSTVSETLEHNELSLSSYTSQKQAIQLVEASYMTQGRDYAQFPDVHATSYTRIAYPYLPGGSAQVEDLPWQLAGTLPTLQTAALSGWAWNTSDISAIGGSTTTVAPSVLQPKANQTVLRMDISTFTEQGTFEAAAAEVVRRVTAAKAAPLGAVYAFNTIQMRAPYYWQFVNEPCDQDDIYLRTPVPVTPPTLQDISNLNNGSVVARKTVLPFALNASLSQAARDVGYSDASVAAALTERSFKQFVSLCHSVGVAVLLETDETTFLGYDHNVLYLVDAIVHIYDQALNEARQALNLQPMQEVEHAFGGVATYLSSRSGVMGQVIGATANLGLNKPTARIDNIYFALHNAYTLQYLAKLHDRFITQFHVDGIVHSLAPNQTDKVAGYAPACLAANHFDPSLSYSSLGFGTSDAFAVELSSSFGSSGAYSSEAGAYSYDPGLFVVASRLLLAYILMQVTFILAGPLPAYVRGIEAQQYSGLQSSFALHTDAGNQYFVCNQTATDAVTVDSLSQCIFQRVGGGGGDDYLVRIEFLKAADYWSYGWLLPPLPSDANPLPASHSVPLTYTYAGYSPYLANAPGSSNVFTLGSVMVQGHVTWPHPPHNEGDSYPPVVTQAGLQWLRLWVRLRLLSGATPVMLQGFEALYQGFVVTSLSVAQGHGGLGATLVGTLGTSVQLLQTHPSFTSIASTVRQVVTAGWQATVSLNAPPVLNDLTPLMPPMEPGSQVSWMVAGRRMQPNGYLSVRDHNSHFGWNLIASPFGKQCYTPLNYNPVTGRLPDVDGDGFGDQWPVGCVSNTTNYGNIPPAPLDVFHLHTLANHHLSQTTIVSLPIPVNTQLVVLVGSDIQCSTTYDDGTPTDQALFTSANTASITCALPPTSLLVFKLVYNTHLPLASQPQPTGSLYRLAQIPASLTAFHGQGLYTYACNQSVDWTTIESCTGSNVVHLTSGVAVIAAGWREPSPASADTDREFAPWSATSPPDKSARQHGRRFHAAAAAAVAGSFVPQGASSGSGSGTAPPSTLCPIHMKTSTLSGVGPCTERRLGATFFDIGPQSNDQARGLMFQYWGPTGSGILAVDVELFVVMPQHHPLHAVSCTTWTIPTPRRFKFPMHRSGDFWMVMINLVTDVMDALPTYNLNLNNLRLEYRYVEALSSGAVIYRTDPYGTATNSWSNVYHADAGDLYPDLLSSSSSSAFARVPGQVGSSLSSSTSSISSEVLGAIDPDLFVSDVQTTILGRPFASDPTVRNLRMAMRTYTDLVSQQTWRSEPLVLYQTVPQLSLNADAAAAWPPKPVVNAQNISTEPLVASFFARRTPPTQVYQTLRRGHLQRLGANAVLLSGLFSDRSTRVNSTWLPGQAAVDLNPLSHSVVANSALFQVDNDLATALPTIALGGHGIRGGHRTGQYNPTVPRGTIGQPLSTPIACWSSVLPADVQLPPALIVAPLAPSNGSLPDSLPAGDDTNLDASTQGVAGVLDWNYALYIEKRLGFESHNVLSLLEYVRECQLRHIRVAVEVSFDSVVAGSPLFRFFQSREVDDLPGRLPDWGFASEAELQQPGSDASGYFFVGSTYLTGSLTASNNQSLWYSQNGPRFNTDNSIVRQFIRDRVQMLIEQFYIDAILLDTQSFLHIESGGASAGNTITSAVTTLRDLHALARMYEGVQFLSSSLDDTSFVTSVDLAPGASLDPTFFSDASPVSTARAFDLQASPRGVVFLPGEHGTVPASTAALISNGTLPLPQRITFTEEAQWTLDGHQRQGAYSDCPFCMFVLPFAALGWPMIYQGQEYLDGQHGSILSIVNQTQLALNVSDAGTLQTVAATDFQNNNVGSPPSVVVADNTTTVLGREAAFLSKTMEWIAFYKNASFGAHGAYMNVFQNESDRYSLRRWRGVNAGATTVLHRPTYILAYFGNGTAPTSANVVSFLIVDRAVDGFQAAVTSFVIERVFEYGTVLCPSTITVYTGSIVNCHMRAGSVAVYAPRHPVLLGTLPGDFNQKTLHLPNAGDSAPLITGNTGPNTNTTTGSASSSSSTGFPWWGILLVVVGGVGAMAGILVAVRLATPPAYIRMERTARTTRRGSRGSYDKVPVAETSDDMMTPDAAAMALSGPVTAMDADVDTGMGIGMGMGTPVVSAGLDILPVAATMALPVYHHDGHMSDGSLVRSRGRTQVRKVSVRGPRRPKRDGYQKVKATPL